MRRSSGYTVIELLVTLTLVLLLFSIAFQIIVPSLRIWIANEAQATLEETSLVLENRIERELERSVQSTVTSTWAVNGGGQPGLSGSLQAFSFASLGEEDSADAFDPLSGEPQWQEYVVYYLDNKTQTVYRKWWSTPPLQTSPSPPVGPQGGAFGYQFPTNQPTALTASELATLCSLKNGTERAVSHFVTTLQLTTIAGQNSGSVAVLLPSNVQLTLQLQAPAPNGIMSLTGPSASANSVTSQRSQQFLLRM